MPLADEEKKRIEEEERFRAEARARANAEISTPKGKGGCSGCLTSIGVLVVALLIIGLFGSRQPNPTLSKQPAFTSTKDSQPLTCAADSVESKVEAERVFRSNLKAPSSAKIISITTTVIKRESDACGMFAKGVLDAQNSFGVELRQTLYVMLACNETVKRCLGSQLFEASQVPPEYK